MRANKNFMENSGNYEFYAFVSYKRGETDEQWARWIQRELERYRIPVGDLSGDEKRGKKNFPRRLRVFRDKSDLGSHSTLEQGLSKNLDASRFLIVVCSRRSAESPYVGAEVRHFVENGRADNILPFFIDPPESGYFPRPPSLPEEMEGVAASEGREEAFIRLLARLLRVDYDNLQQAHLRASRRRMAYRLCAVTAVMVLTTALGLWALAAEARAAKWRGESEKLVDFLTFDLTRETVAWLPSSKLTSISERVQEYYERWEPQEPRAVFAASVNLNRLGSVAGNIAGDREGAIELVSLALELLTSLRANDPDNESFFVEYSHALIKAGGLFEIEGKLEEAEIFYKKSLNAAKAFSDAHPDSLKGRNQAADSLEHLAKLAAARKQFQNANTLYHECGEVWKDMLLRWPEETRTWLWRMKYGNFRSGRGYVDILQSNFTDALDHIEEALTIFGDFHEEDPENLIVRLFYADELGTAAFLASKAGELDFGELFYSAGEELWRGLVAEDPQPGYVFGWARMLMRGGLIRIKQNRGKEAEALLDEAEELIDNLIHLAPDNEAYRTTKESIEEYRDSLE